FYVGITRAREKLWISWAKSRSPGGRGTRRPSRFLPQSLLRGAGVAPSTGAGSRGSSGTKTGSRKLPQCRICGTALFDPTQRKLRRCSGCPADYDEAVFERLRAWRLSVSTSQQMPAYVIFTDATLQAIAEQLPTTEAEMATVPGVGPAKLTNYAEAVLALVAGKSVEDLLESGEMA
ncbi:MAG: HRDC domain-containing protein, partial [Pseudonocardiaceae bacterium]